MTAPTLERMKFWIVVPKAATNQILNPTFASPQGAAAWTASNGSIATTDAQQRFGAYSMQANPQAGERTVRVWHGNLKVENGKAYTYSCHIKGVAGQAMRIFIADAAGNAKATKTFTATGYWNRYEVSWVSNVSAADYRVYTQRDLLISTEPFYVDGCQFEQDSKASTFFDGYSAGCRWTGAIRNSPSARSANTGLGGELLCINDYAAITKHIGFGMGQWNQILTKMTSGGDMYQTHIRKSRTIALNLAYTGNNHGELQANRKVIIDALRPDLLSNLPVNEQFGINMPGSYRGHEQRIIRYQGFDANGNEATQPIDIVCVFEACHSDTPDTETSQRDVLLFTVPSGLFQGAYHEGAALSFKAEFPVKYNVRRDAGGNWCKWNGSSYVALMGDALVPLTGKNSIIETADGEIVNNAWGMYYDGDLFAGLWIGLNKLDANYNWVDGLASLSYDVYPPELTGAFYSFQTLYAKGNEIWATGAYTSNVNVVLHFLAKITKSAGGVWSGVQCDSLTANLNGRTTQKWHCVVVSPVDGMVYAGGIDDSGYAATGIIKKALTPTPGNWSTVATGLNQCVRSLALAPNGDLYVGGDFTNADGSNGDFLCYKKHSENVWRMVGNVELNGAVHVVTFDNQGRLLIGGEFTSAGGVSGADHIARWNGTQWEALGTGTNGTVKNIVVAPGLTKGEGVVIYASGDFTKAGGLTLADRIAMWTNGAWMPLDIDLPGSASVTTILPASDGSLYLTGGFSGANAVCAVITDKMSGIGGAAGSGVASASANTYPVISITGPGELKAITNYSTGKTVMFDGLVLGDGEWISLNFDPLQLSFRSGWAGRGNLMRYVVPGSDYGDFYLKSGVNNLSFFMVGESANTRASIVWSPKFWGIDGALLE